MTPDTPPAPHVPRQGKPARRWPDPGTPSGAVLYAVIAGLIVWIIISILSHVHIIISWHLSVTTVGLEPAPEECRSGKHDALAARFTGTVRSGTRGSRRLRPRPSR